MFSEIRIYFEGDKLLKPGFDAFFEEIKRCARERRCSFYLIAGQSGETACRDFGIALRTHGEDSEGPADADLSASHCRRHHWDASHAGSIFWMVQMMEAWFHADRNALRRFYGPRFKESALTKNPKVEQIPKKDLEDGLREATKDTQKGDYFDHKTSHGPALLAALESKLVREAAPNCQKLFDAILAKLA
jgi:hypothetical protein